MNVNIIKFKVINDSERKTVGEASLIIDELRVNGVRLVKNENGYSVGFPYWRDKAKNTHEYVYPSTPSLYTTILNALITMYEKEAPVVSSTTNICNTNYGDVPSIKNINLHLKRKG